MKYPGVKNETSIESARYPYEKHNEISIEVPDIHTDIHMNSTMKYPGAKNEISIGIT